MSANPPPPPEGVSPGQPAAPAGQAGRCPGRQEGQRIRFHKRRTQENKTLLPNIILWAALEAIKFSCSQCSFHQLDRSLAVPPGAGQWPGGPGQQGRGGHHAPHAGRRRRAHGRAHHPPRGGRRPQHQVQHQGDRWTRVKISAPGFI